MSGLIFGFFLALSMPVCNLIVFYVNEHLQVGFFLHTRLHVMARLPCLFALDKARFLTSLDALGVRVVVWLGEAVGPVDQ